MTDEAHPHRKAEDPARAPWREVLPLEARGNQYGKLRWCTERRRLVVAFWLALANALIALDRLLRRGWVCYRWQGRPRRRP
jgi:hypothetical protein